jgi:hypothetical protein
MFEDSRQEQQQHRPRKPWPGGKTSESGEPTNVALGYEPSMVSSGFPRPFGAPAAGLNPVIL